MVRSGQVRADTLLRAGAQNRLVGWRTGSEVPTHRLGRQPRKWVARRPVRADTARDGDRNRWVGTRNCLSQPTRTCPRSPDVDRPPAQNKPAVADRPGLGTARHGTALHPARPDIAPDPDRHARPAISHTASRRAGHLRRPARASGCTRRRDRSLCAPDPYGNGPGVRIWCTKLPHGLWPESGTQRNDTTAGYPLKLTRAETRYGMTSTFHGEARVQPLRHCRSPPLT